MEAWQTILLAFGGNAALLAVLGFVGKSLLEKLIARDTTQFESDLRAKSDAAIEQLRSNLQLRTIEYQERFSRLQEKRATVIAELYGYLVETLWAAESFLSPMDWAGEPDKKEKHQIAMTKLVDFFRYFEKNRIYLPPEICSSLEGLVLKVRSHVIKFGVYVKFNEPSMNDRTREEKGKAWNEAWDAIKNQVPESRKLLEDEFRELLGATSTSPPPQK